MTEPTTQDPVDASYLQSLVGYNTRRASLTIIEHFMQRMAAHALRPVDFSVLSLIHHNPGITSRQLCAALGLQPPNLVGLLQALERRGLLARKPHPHDGRAIGLHLNAQGRKLAAAAERSAQALEDEATAQLTAHERQTLIHLLQKIYTPS